MRRTSHLCLVKRLVKAVSPTTTPAAATAASAALPSATSPTTRPPPPLSSAHSNQPVSLPSNATMASKLSVPPAPVNRTASTVMTDSTSVSLSSTDPTRPRTRLVKKIIKKKRLVVSAPSSGAATNTSINSDHTRDSSSNNNNNDNQMSTNGNEGHNRSMHQAHEETNAAAPVSKASLHPSSTPSSPPTHASSARDAAMHTAHELPADAVPEIAHGMDLRNELRGIDAPVSAPPPPSPRPSHTAMRTDSHSRARVMHAAEERSNTVEASQDLVHRVAANRRHDDTPLRDMATRANTNHVQEDEEEHDAHAMPHHVNTTTTTTTMHNNINSENDYNERADQPSEEGTSSSSSSTATAAASDASVTARGKKTPMIKSFRIDEILPACTASDAVFARRLPSGGCQFFAWPGTPLAVAAAAIVSMPDTIRTVHTVFGRTGVPMDLVMDIDCPVPQEYWSMSRIRPYQVKILDEVLTVIHARLAEMGERVASQVVLQSPNLKKASFHVHTKLVDAAFEDYHSLHGFLASMHDRIPTVDLQIYRPNGMLRMYSCMKENRTSAMTVFDEPRWNMGFGADGSVPEAAAALHSLCIREAGTYRRLLHFDAPRLCPSGSGSGGRLYGLDGADEEELAGGRQSGGALGSPGADDGDGLHHHGEGNYGRGNGRPRRVPVLLPRTEREAVMNASRWLRQATEVEVGEWRSWIALGLCAFRVGHHFQNVSGLPRPAMEEMLDAWVEASRHCPQKFKHGDCETRWASFDIHKLKGNSDSKWWSAYQYIGRLTVPMQEALRREETARAVRSGRQTRQVKPGSAS